MANPRYCSPYLLDELSEFPEWGKDAVVLVDEISAYAASERSTSRATVDLGILLTQVRKWAATLRKHLFPHRKT